MDSGNQYIYPTSASQNSHRPTGSHKKLSYKIFGEDGKILPTDETGAYINTDGKLIPTNFYGEPLNSERSSVLATDTSGRYHVSKKKLTDKQMPTNINDYHLYSVTDPDLKTISDEFVSTPSGSLSLVILFPDGHPLSVGENGVYLDDNGQSLVHIDQNGRPVISADGTPLQKIGDGKYLYPYESQKEEKTILTNVADDDHLLRTDPEGRQVQLTGRGKSVDGYSSSSPEDKHGNYTWNVETTARYHASTFPGLER